MEKQKELLAFMKENKLNPETKLYRYTSKDYLKNIDGKLYLKAKTKPTDMIIDIYNGSSEVFIASEMGQGISFLSNKEEEYESFGRVCIEIKIKDVLDQEGLIYPITSLPEYLKAFYCTIPKGLVKVKISEKIKVNKPEQQVVKLNPRVTQLFKSLDVHNRKYIYKSDLLETLNRCGILSNDLRIKKVVNSLDEFEDSKKIDLEDFNKLIYKNVGIIEKTIKGDLIIPDFHEFCNDITNIYNEVNTINEGDVADYIPELAKVDPKKFAISICTVDGQIFNIGDSNDKYCIQSTCKPINYCLALQENGENKVHQHVGFEPSGVSFNEIILGKGGLPHNPMVNAGAIMSCSLIKPSMDDEDRMEHVLNTWRRITGIKPAVDNKVYMSERDTADRNFALAYFMKEKRAFPENTNLLKTLEFYFKCCSIEVTAQEHAIVAATLANGGISPVTGKKIFKPETIKNCLSLMYSCGMYDYSGKFAFKVGIPAKSGVSGAIFVVIPNVMGITIWSPPLDEIGNSVKGLAVCTKLVNYFNFHTYDHLLLSSSKKDPRLQKNQTKIEGINSLCAAASQGDLDEFERLANNELDLNESEYDYRTPIHLAASEGHVHVIKYFIEKGLNLSPKDRWGGTPLDDAYRGNHQEVIQLLEKHHAQKSNIKGIPIKEFLPDTLKNINLKDSIKLCWAASEGDLIEIKRLVANGLNLNAADYDGRTALHLSASEGHINVVNYLIKHGVYVNPLDRWGNTPLTDAYRHDFQKVIKLLEENGGAR